MNQTKIAKMLGMSQTGYSKYETGENDIPTQIIIRLALFYQVSIDYLLGLTDQPDPYPRAKNHPYP
jgi:transcriptional regulator with XRE-family HTH domain